MANRISQLVRWSSSFDIDGASFTPAALAGKILVDATGRLWPIAGNNASTLYFNSDVAPQVGKCGTFTGAGWTAHQYRNGQVINGVWTASELVDDNSTRFTILDNTTDTLVLLDGGVPELSAGNGYILQGGKIQVRLPAPSSSFGGYWFIIDADGTPYTDYTVKTGDVTATAGGTSLPAAAGGTTIHSGIASVSQPLDLEGVESITFTGGFISGDATSPSGTLSFQVNNQPGPDLGAQQNYDPPGPGPLDPGWVDAGVSADGADVGTEATITDTDPHLIVPMLTPYMPLGYARWGRLTWTPDDMAPGTGSLTIAVYGYGPK